MAYDMATEKRKRALADALKDLMGKKPLSKITINELTEKSGSNRNTFYYHFEDIYDLLRWTLKQESVEVIKQFDLILNAEDAISFVMDYVETNRHILNCAYDSMGRDGMRRFFYDDFIAMIGKVIDHAEAEAGLCTEGSFKQFLADFYTEALASMLINLFHGAVPYDRQELTKNTLLILKAAIPNALRAHCMARD